MKTALGALLFSSAAATELKLTWSDCGDSSTHAKISGFTPPTASTGATTHMVGTATLDEDISGATFDMEINTAVGVVSCKGDASMSKTCSLPMGSGAVTFNAMSFPIKAGAASVSVDLKLDPPPFLPGSLLKTDVRVSAVAANGDKLLCMEVKSAPATEAEEVHPDRLAQIKEIENTPGVLWKAVPHPRFASQAPGTSKYMMGVKGDQKKAIKDLKEQGEIVEATADPDMQIADSFDSAENWPQCAKLINDIRDQSNCGCCWAFAGAEAASDRMCITTNASMMVPISAQDVCFNGGGLMSRGCNGGQITTPWSYMKTGGWFGGKGAVSGGQYQGSGPFGKGLCSDFSMPHCHHHGPQGDDPYPAEGKAGCPTQTSAAKFSKCDADATAPHNDFANDKYSYTGNTVTATGIEGIQKAIMAGGPMEVAFTVYSDFENYASGIYHHVTGDQVGGHAVKVVGWGAENGVKYWKIANSWNPYWGEKGYFRIKFGEGGIDDQAIGSDPSAKWSWAGHSKEIVV